MEKLAAGPFIEEIRSEGGSPLERLRRASRVASTLTATADDLLDLFVSEARAAGHSWAEIGTEVGVSKQAAQQRFVTDGGLPGPIAAPGSKRLDFTRRLRRILKNATREARRRGHTYVGTEHTLMAMLDEPECTARVVLEHLGVSAEELLAALETHAQAPVRKSRGRFTRSARDLIENSVMDAMGLGHNYVDTEHLLLAGTRSHGSAAAALAELGVSYDRTRAAIGHVLATPRTA